MKIWFTRPSTWDLWVRGIRRCTLWLEKPIFDSTPRGDREHPRLAHLPIGWRVLDPLYGDISAQVSMDVEEVMATPRYSQVTLALWDALCRSVDGLGPDEGVGAPRRWEERVNQPSDDEAEHRIMSTFLFEYNAPPGLWFETAWKNGIEYQTAAGRWAQKVFPVDIEHGIEPDEAPPIENPVIHYGTGCASVDRS